ncbi:MAG: hypothetical protein JXA91_00080 [Candidatus Thermoplasmatota archaeon]|nr:hypothetical protein [Candidatus Thermoplasmatota archaeon]
MIDNNIPRFGFQNFYASRQESKCPLIPRAVAFLNKLIENHPKLDLFMPIISLSYGKRIIINSPSVQINERNFLEIVDYDPIKQTYLLIGLSEPPIDAPLHWIVLNAKKEINVLLQMKLNLSNNKSSKKFPHINGEFLHWSLEKIGEILKLMRNTNIIIIGKDNILCAGFDLKEVESSILKIIEDRL